MSCWSCISPGHISHRGYIFQNCLILYAGLVLNMGSVFYAVHVGHIFHDVCLFQAMNVIYPQDVRLIPPFSKLLNVVVHSNHVVPVVWSDTSALQRWLMERACSPPTYLPAVSE